MVVVNVLDDGLDLFCRRVVRFQRRRRILDVLALQRLLRDRIVIHWVRLLRVALLGTLRVWLGLLEVLAGREGCLRLADGGRSNWRWQSGRHGADDLGWDGRGRSGYFQDVTQVYIGWNGRLWQTTSFPAFDTSSIVITDPIFVNRNVRKTNVKPEKLLEC
jgi:hypothetical protein